MVQSNEPFETDDQWSTKQIICTDNITITCYSGELSCADNALSDISMGLNTIARDYVDK